MKNKQVNKLLMNLICGKTYKIQILTSGFQMAYLQIADCAFMSLAVISRVLKSHNAFHLQCQESIVTVTSVV